MSSNLSNLSIDAFLFFDGNCKEAVEFYANIFNVEAPQMITYGQNPDVNAGPNAALEKDKDRILYAHLPVSGHTIMFSDCPSGQKYIKGNNVAVTVSGSDAQEIKRIYEALSEEGQVLMLLGKTFFSNLFAMVCDKFGVIWQISLTKE